MADVHILGTGGPVGGAVRDMLLVGVLVNSADRMCVLVKQPLLVRQNDFSTRNVKLTPKPEKTPPGHGQRIQPLRIMPEAR